MNVVGDVTRRCPDGAARRPYLAAETGSLQRRNELDHALPGFRIGQTSDAGLDVVFKMKRVVGRGNGAGDGRIGDNPFQEKLRPGSTIEFSGPIGQGL